MKKILLSLSLLLVFCTLPLLVSAEVKPEEEKFVADVMARMTAVSTPPGYQWPPLLQVQDNQDTNAFAYTTNEDGKKIPHVVVFTGLLREIVQGKPDRLALVLGHEIGHNLLGHSAPSSARDATDFRKVTFTREQENAADLFGMQWTLKAGYSYKEALMGFRRFLDSGSSYTSFEGLGLDHPSWLDRIAILDKEQTRLWHNMSAFSTGVYFLNTEQYVLAERCFREVTKEFPDAYDAWANLGYSLLMQYADALEPEDLRRFSIGQIVVGGFYRRPGSLEAKVRGVNEELWWSAVGALREALRVRPNLALANANLGVAYLIRPAGKDAGKAMQYLEQGAQLAPNDKTLDQYSRAAMVINLGLAYGAAGRTAEFNKELDAAEALLSSARNVPTGLQAALMHNRALALASSGVPEDQRSAIKQFETYLRRSDTGSAWWALAYTRYKQLCSTLQLQPKSESEFQATGSVAYRPIGSLELGNGKYVTLGEPVSKVKARFGEGQVMPAVSGTNLVSIRYPAFTILANDQVLAILVGGDVKPSLYLRETGTSSKKMSIQVGMTKAEFEKLVPDTPVFGQLIDPEKNYRFYADLGIAVRIQDGKVAELVIVQAPRVKTL